MTQDEIRNKCYADVWQKSLVQRHDSTIVEEAWKCGRCKVFIVQMDFDAHVLWHVEVEAESPR